MEKLSRKLLVPYIIIVVCSVIFNDYIKDFKYTLYIRYFLLLIAITFAISAIIGLLRKNNFYE